MLHFILHYLVCVIVLFSCASLPVSYGLYLVGIGRGDDVGLGGLYRSLGTVFSSDGD